MGGTDEIYIEKNGRMEADGSERYVLVLEITLIVGFVAWNSILDLGVGWSGRGWGAGVG